MLSQIKRMFRLRNAAGHIINIRMSIYELIQSAMTGELRMPNPKVNQIIEDINLADGMGITEADVVRIFREIEMELEVPADRISAQKEYVINSTFRKKE